MHKMEDVALRNLSNFFLLVGNGDTLETLRGLIKEVEGGVSLEDIFKKVVSHARIQADKEEDLFQCFREWTIIAGHTGEDADLARAEDLLPKIHSPNQRGVAKKLLVKALAKAGHLEDARTVSGNIKNAYWRAEAYLKLYEISNDAGDISSAIFAAEHINGADAKGEVLAQIKAARPEE